jgi:UDP-N-acetylmuramoyl-tripeptide--D-alanyl-D-alanine ligase
MIPISIAKIAEIVEGQIVNLDPALIIEQSPEIDSRKVDENSFFVALIGEKVDGHQYAKESIAKGAKFVLGSKVGDYPAIIVDDPIEALSKLATYNRNALENLTVIGITGSQGKTTVKDMLAQILAPIANTVWTEASFNNELGVPLTLLKANLNSKYVILEMGARHVGDISHLCHIARPNIGVVLVVGTAHIEIFGSQADIAKAKKELIDSLAEDGIAILGSSDPFTPKMADGRSIKKIIYGDHLNKDYAIDIRATDIELREGLPHFELVTPMGRAPITLQYHGLHQINNALAAISVAISLGVNFEKVCSLISLAKPMSKWRMEIKELQDILIINDAYNANPESMKAAIETLAHFSSIRGGQSWAILGKMWELGRLSLEQHEKLGKIVAENEIDHLVEVGDNGIINGAREVNPNLGYHPISTLEDFMELTENFVAGDAILIKASRAEGLEKFYLALEKKFTEGDAK